MNLTSQTIADEYQKLIRTTTGIEVKDGCLMTSLLHEKITITAIFELSENIVILADPEKIRIAVGDRFSNNTPFNTWKIDKKHTEKLMELI